MITGLNAKIDYLLKKLPRFRAFVKKYLVPEVITTQRKDIEVLVEKLQELDTYKDRAELTKKVLAWSGFLNSELRLLCDHRPVLLANLYLATRLHIEDPEKLPQAVRDEFLYYLDLFLWLTNNHRQAVKPVSLTTSSTSQSLTTRAWRLFSPYG